MTSEHVHKSPIKVRENKIVIIARLRALARMKEGRAKKRQEGEREIEL